jgi:hypothetical protein
VAGGGGRELGSFSSASNRRIDSFAA